MYTYIDTHTYIYIHTHNAHTYIHITHTYTHTHFQFPRTAFLPYHSTMGTLVVLIILSMLDILFAALALVHIRRARHQALRLFAFYKMISLGIYMWVFLFTTAWVGSEVIIWLLYLGFSLVCMWSTFMLAVALLRGPQDAVGAGFPRHLVSAHECVCVHAFTCVACCLCVRSCWSMLSSRLGQCS
jgi:hypothetical protein